MKNSLACIIATLIVTCVSRNGLADEAKSLLENVLEARYQYTNFEALIVVEQEFGEVWEMPAKMEYRIRVDEVNDRSWIHRRPLVDIALPEDDMQLRGKRSRWFESFSMHRDHQWSFVLDGRLLLRSEFHEYAHMGYSVFSLGFSIYPQYLWTSDTIDSNRGVLGLNSDPRQLRVRPESIVVNDVLLEAVDCTEANGKLRTAWVERATLRLHKVEIPYPFFSYELKADEFGTTTITSSFLPENDTVVPNRVVIEETLNGTKTRRIKIDLVQFDREKKFTDEDFSYTNMGLRINNTVWNADTGTFLGYWNGRNWSSKQPIQGGEIVNAAIESSKNPPRKSSPFRTIAISSMAIALILLSIWVWRRFANTN